METTIMGYIGIIGCMGGYQNYGPFLGTLNIRCRTIIGIQKGTIILTTTLFPAKDHWALACFCSKCLCGQFAGLLCVWK